MANTIKIKRSTTTTIPGSLAEGELAYSEYNNTDKLYIGTGAGATIDVIGGKHYTDQIDTVTAGTIHGRASGAGDGVMQELSAAQVRTIINVEDGATADQTAGEIEAIVSHDNLLDFAAAEHYDWSSDISGTATIHANNITGYSVAGWTASGDANSTPALGDKIRHASLTATRTSTLPGTFNVGDDAIWLFNEDDGNDVTVTPASGDSIWLNGASLGVDSTYTLSPGEMAVLFPRTQDAQWAMMVFLPSDHGHTVSDISDAGALASLNTVGTTEIDNDAVTYAKIQNVVSDNVILGNNAGAGGVVDELTAAEVRTILGVEAGATADQTDSEIETAYNNQVSKVSAPEIAAGTETAVRRWSVTDVKSMVETWETGTPGDNTITNTKLADMAQNTIKGRITASTGDPEDLTAANVRTIINVEDGADVTDATNVAAAGAVMESDTTTALMSFVIDEDAMGSNLDTKVPTQQSVKAYVDASVSSSLTYKGAYNATTNSPDLDTSPSGVLTGDTYTVTVAGTFFTTAVEVGDVLIAEADSATTEAEWTIVNKNIDYATDSTPGIVELATIEETNTGTDTTRAVTPDGLDGWTGSAQIATVGTITSGTWTGGVIAEAYLQNQSGTNTGDEPAASETVVGVVELATAAETQTGTDDTRAIHPAGLAAWTGSTNITTLGTIGAGTWQGSTINATYLPAASLTASGIVEVADQTEVDTGSDTLRTVSPSTLHNTTFDGGTF